MNASTTAPLLLFRWEGPRRRRRALIALLIASFFAHVGCFYLFQIVYPPTVSLMPAPQRVNLISANSEQAVTLLHWLDAEDPALVSTTRRPPYMRRYEIGKVEHIPSYFEREPTLKEAPPPTVDLRIPSAQAPGPVPVSARVSTKPIGTSATTLTFSNELNRLGQAKPGQVNFQASTHEPPQNAQFRIGVDAQGAVVYCFAITSSGDAALDEQARKYLALCRFPARGPTANANSLVWGIATIEWGNDVGATKAKSTPSAP